VNFSKPLFWHQGLFLQPQHFQYQTYYNQKAQTKLLEIENGFPWGLISAQFSAQSLARGNVELEYFDALFEDGTMVSFPDNVQIGSRAYENHWTDRSKPLNVYLAIAKMSSSHTNVTQVAGYDNDQVISTRYVSLIEGEDVKDLHQGEQSVAVKTMKHVVRVIFEDEIEKHSDYLLLPLTRLEEIEDDVRFSKEYVPPCMSIKASSSLMESIKEIRDELVGRSKQLENYKSTTTSRTAEFNPVAERYRNALKVLARYAPLLNHYLENPVAAPYEIYGQLRALVGELSTFSSGYSILGDSNDGRLSTIKYNHRDLFTCFDTSKQVIVSLLDELTVSPELLVKLNKESDGYFNGQLPSEFFLRQHSMYLVLETTTPVSDYLSSFLSYAKLGSKEQVVQYVQRAIPGISFEHYDEQPTGLERRPRVAYFTIDRTSAKWKQVEEQGHFALQWDDAPEDLKVEMVLVRG
jgi:type VI secretion system protein ImpJ